jgi:hypothetical protein
MRRASVRLLWRRPSPGRLRPLYSPGASSILDSMQLRDLLRRLWPKGAGRSASAKTRYDDASRLEETTQTHYRSITGSDAGVRPTKADDAGDPPQR